ncbi:Potassium voltage-gated channel sub H member 8, partial [Coelomomyces lativittatus]
MNFFHSIIKSLREHVPTLSTLKAFSDPKSQFNKLHEAWKASKLLIIPQSAFFNFQEYFVLAATFFQLIYVPFNATFQDPTNDVQPIEVILLIIFLTDIVLNFHTAYYNDQGQLVINQKAAYRHYLKYRFAFDLIGCFPFEYITRVFLPPLTTERVRFIKLVQLYRFRMAMINHEGTSTNSEKYSLTVYIFMIFLCFHFMACFWWMLQVDLKDTYQNTWANTNSMNVNLYNAYQDGLPFLLYIHSIRFTLNAVTMPGYGVLALFSPNTLPETVVAMVYNLFGVFIVAIYLAKYTGFITNIVEAKAAAELRALNMIRFMEKEKLQRSFQIRALHYLQMIWKKTRGHEEQDRFHDLPKCSLTDLQCEACEKYLRMCLIFENASSGFLRLLSVNVERLNLIPAEIVVRKGEYGTSMYIIRNGYAQVVSDDMKW